MKLSVVAKFTVAFGTFMAVGFTANQAHGIVHNLKTNLSLTKSDPLELLALRNWGLDNSDQPSHINARKAWKLSKGDKNIVVAVIDTGIDEKQLGDSLWRKKGTNEYGYDFVLNKKNPGDSHGHGTHVAGITHAVAPNVKIMAVRYYSDSASGAKNLSNTVKAINYAIDNGANIINYSGGGAEFSASELKAIQRAEAKGIVFVAAAGNEYQDTDKSGNSYYPAAYGLSNIIAVAATNIRNQLLSSSNWGLKHVHVAAPGENIYSTMPKGRFGYLTGTSQATAFVSGIAALVLSTNPKLSPAEVRNIIMKSVDKIKGLETKIASAGRVNAYKALRLTLAQRDGKEQQMLAELQKMPSKDTVALPSKINRGVAFK